MTATLMVLMQLVSSPALGQAAGGTAGPLDPLQVQPPPPPPSPADEDPDPELEVDPETGEVSDEFGRLVRAPALADRLGDAAVEH